MSNIILDNKQMINSMHNDIQCISLESATRPCDRCWFTSKQIQEWSGMTQMTIDRRLSKLVNVGRITGMKETTSNIIATVNKELESTNSDILQENSTNNKFVASETPNKNNSDIIELNLPHKTGSKVTKLYNLNVLNQLAMIEYENEKLNTISNKFSDILCEVETTGSYNIQKQSPSYMIEDPIERAEAWIKEQKEKRALEAEKKELEEQKRVLEAEKETLSTDLELARSTMFTNKRICGMIRDKFNIKYADSTLKKKTSKALQAIANELKENITYRTEFVDGVLRSIPYYTLQTANRLIQQLESDYKYLKQY